MKNITEIIDDFVEKNLLSQEDYNKLLKYVSQKCNQYNMGTQISNDVLNAVLLFLKTNKNEYNISYNDSAKRKYINLTILKFSKDVVKKHDFIVDAGVNKIFPLRDMDKQWTSLSSIGNTINYDNEVSFIDDTANNSLFVNNIMDSLNILTDRELDIFIDIFISGLTQQQVALDKNITQQCVLQIVKWIKKKLKRLVNSWEKSTI